MNELEELYSNIQNKIGDRDFSFKKDLVKTGWFRYFFKERSRISIWGKNTGLLKASFFSVSITGSFKKKVRDFYNLIIAPIIPFCKNLCEKGWRWKVVSIKEYNLIVYLYDFCKKVEEFDKKSYFDFKNFAAAEKAFFNLAININYPAAIYRTVEKVFASYPDEFDFSGAQQANVLLSIENLFNYQMMPVSFYKFSQAYNMYLFKTYYDWKDIIIDSKAQMVNKVFYNCSYQTFTEIISYARTIIRILEGLEKEKEQARWLFELTSHNETTATGEIVQFFSSLGFKYDEYRKDFFLFVITLFGGLIRRLELFITSKWTLIDFEEREIREKLVFDSQVESCFKSLTDEYSKLKSRFTATVVVKLEITEYFETQSFEAILPDDSHLLLYRSFGQVTSLLFDLAILLHKVYETKEKPSAESEFLLYMIEKPDSWQGKSAAGVYRYYYELLITIAHFFKEGKLETIISSITGLSSKIETHKSILRSVLDTTNVLEEWLSANLPDNTPEKK